MAEAEFTPSRSGRSWLPRVALTFNLVAAAGCAALIMLAPTRAGGLLAAVGLVFFSLAATAFAMMLRLWAKSTLSRDDAP